MNTIWGTVVVHKISSVCQLDGGVDNSPHCKTLGGNSSTGFGQTRWHGIQELGGAMGGAANHSTTRRV
eukprot:scaffold6562_cov163-Amphora_coffeaeformis.AAC.15